MPTDVAVASGLIEKRFPVLYGQGFVELIDNMGTDHSVAAAARLTAQSKGLTGDHIKDDRGLLRYLMRHRHTTPIEFAEVHFKVHVPMDVWRQWIRHRTANANEYSTRYSPAIDDMLRTPADKWRLQSKSNRQGSSGSFVSKEQGEYLSDREAALHQLAREVYNERVQLGVALEQARKDLPLSTFTEAMWKCDLHNLFHFLGLRMDPHAQLEIRECAGVIGREIVSKLYPILWEAFCDFELQASRLSGVDIATMKAAMALQSPPFSVRTMLQAIPAAWRSTKPHRERDECLIKFRDMDLITFEPTEMQA